MAPWIKTAEALGGGGRDKTLEVFKLDADFCTVRNDDDLTRLVRRIVLHRDTLQAVQFNPVPESNDAPRAIANGGIVDVALLDALEASEMSRKHLEHTRLAHVVQMRARSVDEFSIARKVSFWRRVVV